jgi:hypothetical protein
MPMALVLTENSQIVCPHQGQVSTSSGEKLMVSGAKVLVLSGVQGASVSGCGNPTDNKGDKTCLTVTMASGTAGKLTSGGNAVVLDSLTGNTDGAPPPPPGPSISVSSVGHNKLTAV